MQERKQREQRPTRDRQISDLEKSFTRASDLIRSSKREVQRSRDLLDAQKADDARQDERDARGS